MHSIQRKSRPAITFVHALAVLLAYFAVRLTLPLGLLRCWVYFAGITSLLGLLCCWVYLALLLGLHFCRAYFAVGLLSCCASFGVGLTLLLPYFDVGLTLLFILLQLLMLPCCWLTLLLA